MYHLNVMFPTPEIKFKEIPEEGNKMLIVIEEYYSFHEGLPTPPPSWTRLCPLALGYTFILRASGLTLCVPQIHLNIWDEISPFFVF